MSEPRTLPQSPPSAYAESYARMRDVPADVLAGRVVGSIIRCKGDLAQYKHVLTELIVAIREEYEEYVK